MSCAAAPASIDEIAGSVLLDGKVKGAARRALTPALAIRLTLLMTLMPDADYAEVLAVLLGDLALVPWQRPYALPTATVFCTWRDALGPAPLERLRDRLLSGVDAEHRGHDYRAVAVGDLEVGSIDGSLIRVPDSPANRQAFGSAGTADDSAPFPQLRELRCTAASTRAALGVVTGPSGAGASRDKGEAEQALLDKTLKDFRQVFTPGRLWVMDRNFPGVPRIKAMLATGTHVLIRVKDGITLRRCGDFLPDGSYLAVICGGGITLTVRVVEYTVTVAGRDAPELFCLITDLHDHEAYPAGVLAEAYHWRWIGSETALKEAKSAISGAGPSTGPILRSQSPALIRPGARRLGDLSGTGPRHRAGRRRERGPGAQGPPGRPARPSPGDLLHRRPPRRHRRHPLRRGHRKPARRADPGLPGSRAGRPGPPPHRHRPRPAP